MQKETPASILIVDDFEWVLELLKEMVSALGDFRVITVSSGERALEVIAREAPDLALVDIAMPGMDGLEVCRIIKSEEETAHIPVILMTAISKEKVKKDRYIMKLGIDDFLQRPVTFSELKDLVSRYLKISDSGPPNDVLPQTDGNDEC